MSAIFTMLLTWVQSAEGMALLTSNLPKLLDFASSLNTKIAEARAKGLGHDEAVQQATDQIAAILKTAADAAAKAEADHLAHPNDDGGFDPDVFRPEGTS